MLPPFRAEHIGSLKRPQRLIDAHYKFSKGDMEKSALEQIEVEEIRVIVKMQQRLGFKAMTDGEYRRSVFFDGFFEHLEGMTFVQNADESIFMEYLPNIRFRKKRGMMKGLNTYLCTGKIRRTKACYVPHFEALSTEVEPADVKYIKVTIAPPEWYHLQHSSKYAYTEEAYNNEAEYFGDIAKAYREELDALYAAGCRNVQIDNPCLTFFCSDMVDDMRAVGVDPDALLNTYIELQNDCLSNKKADMTIGMHLCRGNTIGSMNFTEGGYDAIAAKLFKQSHVDCFYLEYDTPRAGTFEPLRELPMGKKVVLGLISSKVPELEDKQHVIARLDEAARIMEDPEKERICLSPQCGFASRIEGNTLTQADVEKKLALVSEIAEEGYRQPASRRARCAISDQRNMSLRTELEYSYSYTKCTHHCNHGRERKQMERTRN